MWNKVRSYWPIIAIFILWFVFSAPFLLRGLIPFPSKYLVTFFPPWNATYAMPVKNAAMPDVITQIYPWKLLTIDTWRSGKVPLWNPYSFSGTGNAANYQSAVFTPFNLLFFIFNFTDAWSWIILLQPLLAGLFMYIFLKTLNRSDPAALLGSIGFMFCGFLTTWMAYGTLGYAILWLPLILTGIVRQNKRIHWLNGILISLGIAMSLVAGHFQISLYVIIFSTLFIIFEFLMSKQVKAILFSFVYLVLGIFIVSPQLILTYGSYVASVRSGSFIKGEVIPWKYIVTFLSPDYYGNPVTRNDWFGHYAEWASYIGIIPLILSVYACLKSLKGFKKFFLAAVILAICLSYQTPLTDLLFAAKIPVLSTSAASRIIVIASFFMAALAAYGLDDICQDIRSKNKSIFLKESLLFIGILVILWFLVYVVHILPIDKLIVAKRNLYLPTALTLLSISIIFIAFIKRKYFLIFVTLLLIICAFDSYRYAAKWLPFEPKEYIYPQTKMLTYLENIVGQNRVFGNFGGEMALPFKFPSVEGYDAMYQARYGIFASSLNDGNLGSSPRSTVNFDRNGLYTLSALQLLGTKYFMHRISDGRNIWAFPVWQYSPDTMKSIYRDETYELFEYTKTYPRAFLASNYLIENTDSGIINNLFKSDINRRETLILEEKPNIKPESGDGEVSIKSYTENEVIIETNSKVAKLLFLSDVFDPGWQVYIDKQESRIYRADFDFRAVSLNPGRHIVIFSYEPSGFRMGLIISGISFLIILGATITIAYANRYL
jgi:hypothetical protein